MPDISILIITYNRPDDLLPLLQDIHRFHEKETLLKEVIIINNNSSVSYAEVEHFIRTAPDVNWVYHNSPENLGVSRGRNKAIELSTGRLLMLLDDDLLIPDQAALQKIMGFYTSAFAADNKVAALTPLILYASTNEIQVTAFPHKKFSKYHTLPRFLTSYYTGAAHIIDRSVLKVTGLLPENFFYGMEEYDLSYRIIMAGHSLAFDNALVVLHKESPTGRLPPREKLFMMWQNKSKVARRYLPAFYFYSTFILWSFHYLVKSRMHLKGWLKGLSGLNSIRAEEKRQPLPPAAIKYLKKTEARLFY